MNSFISKITLMLLIIVNAIAFGQNSPPLPESPESGGPGTMATSPVDMYLVWLGLVATSIIIYIVKNNTKKLA